MCPRSQSTKTWKYCKHAFLGHKNCLIIKEFNMHLWWRVGELGEDSTSLQVCRVGVGRKQKSWRLRTCVLHLLHQQLNVRRRKNSNRNFLVINRIETRLSWTAPHGLSHSGEKLKKKAEAASHGVSLQRWARFIFFFDASPRPFSTLHHRLRYASTFFKRVNSANWPYFCLVGWTVTVMGSPILHLAKPNDLAESEKRLHEN